MLIAFLIVSVLLAIFFINIMVVPYGIEGALVKVCAWAYLIWTIILLSAVMVPMIAASGIRLI